MRNGETSHRPYHRLGKTFSGNIFKEEKTGERTDIFYFGTARFYQERFPDLRLFPALF